MNTMMNNAFAQQQMVGGYFNQPNAAYYGQPQPQQYQYTIGGPVFANGQPVVNNGLAFAPVQQAIHTACTDEELAKIRQLGGNVTFDMTEEDILRAKWDFRDGTNLAIELIDPKTQRVRVKYTGEEFNLVIVDDATIKEFTEIGDNIVGTTKITNTNLDPVKSQQLYAAWGIVRKLLPIAYKSGKKALNGALNQAKSQTTNTGYMGQNGMNQYMFGGMYGQAPRYVVNDGSTPPQMNYQYQAPQVPGPQYQVGYGYQQPMDPNTWIPQAQPQMMPSGTPMPVGGTMMNNPFTQGGVPQQMPGVQAPPQVGQPVAQPSVPVPGTPVAQPQVQPTANPSIGATVAQPTTTEPTPATTATAPF